MQQDCRNAATMAQAASLAFDMASDEEEVRSGFWRFGAPEYYTLAVIVSVAIATYIFVTGDAQSERLLTPALVAAILVVNLVPAMTLIVLLGSRVARAPAARTVAGGNGGEEARWEGETWVRTVRSRWSRVHLKKKKT